MADQEEPDWESRLIDAHWKMFQAIAEYYNVASPSDRIDVRFSVTFDEAFGLSVAGLKFERAEKGNEPC